MDGRSAFFFAAFQDSFVHPFAVKPFPAVFRDQGRMDIDDLVSVSFMDYSGIGIVLGRYKVVSKGGGRLRIINANRRVERILRMAGIFSIAEYRQRRA